MSPARNNDPLNGLSTMHSQLDDLFNSFFVNMPRVQGIPAVDVYAEDDKELVAEVQAPGFTKSDIEVNVHNGVLEIRGERHEKDEKNKGKKRNYMLRESHASFYRSIALPKTADADKVKAHFEDGVLKVLVPLKELPEPKKVVITDGKKE
jgi:HSP20 family protein